MRSPDGWKESHKICSENQHRPALAYHNVNSNLSSDKLNAKLHLICLPFPHPFLPSPLLFSYPLTFSFFPFSLSSWIFASFGSHLELAQAMEMLFCIHSIWRLCMSTTWQSSFVCSLALRSILASQITENTTGNCLLIFNSTI